MVPSRILGSRSVKPLVSVNGSVELGFGITAVVAGLLYFAFPGREAGAFESGVFFASGACLAAYGYQLRKEWNKEAQEHLKSVEAEIREEARAAEAEARIAAKLKRE